VSYATVQDVLNAFPRFQTSLPNNVSNAAITSWLDMGKAEIRARFLRRGLDPDQPSTLGWNPPLTVLTTDQANVLRKFNAAYGIARFGNVIYSQLSKGEIAVIERAWKEWGSMAVDADGKSSKFILGNDGTFDALFSPDAAIVQISPQLGGIAGAVFDPEVVNNRSMGTHFMFEKTMKF